MLEHESPPPVAGPPDPAGAPPVLIGGSQDKKMDDLPAVKRNLARLKDLLTAPDVWGVPERQCTVVHNPASAVEAIDALHAAAAAATTALVVYFAGHGLLDSNADLYLVPGDADH